MKEKLGLPIVLLLVLALTRVPGMLPENFSAVYALVFCAGVFLPARMGWWLPMATMVVTDLGLNLYYQFALGLNVLTPGKLFYLGGNYMLNWALLVLASVLLRDTIIEVHILYNRRDVQSLSRLVAHKLFKRVYHHRCGWLCLMVAMGCLPTRRRRVRSRNARPS